MSSLLVSAPISAAIALCAYFFVVPSDLKIYIGGQVKSAPMQERLQATTAEREAYQTELLSERAQFQNLKLQVEGLQATITSLREEIANVRASEDEKRLELKRRLEKQVRDRDEDLVLMENQLGERKKDIMEKRGELDKMQIELENVRARAAVAATSHAAATKSHEEAAAFLQRDLVESRDRNEKTEAVLVVVRRDLETSRAELARHVNSLAEAQATAEANAARADLLQEKILSWRPAASAEDKASVMGWSLLCFLVVVGSFSFLARRLSQALQAQQEGSAHTPSGGQGQSGRSNSHRRATSAPAAPGRYTIRNHTGSMSSTSRVATPPVPVSSGQVPLPRFGRLPEISLVPTPTSHSGAPLRSGAPPGTSLDSDDRMSARCNMSTQARSRSTSPSAQDLDETIDISKLLGAAAPNETKAEASSSSTARAQCTDPDDFLEGEDVRTVELPQVPRGETHFVGKIAEVPSFSLATSSVEEDKSDLRQRLEALEDREQRFFQEVVYDVVNAAALANTQPSSQIEPPVTLEVIESEPLKSEELMATALIGMSEVANTTGEPPSPTEMPVPSIEENEPVVPKGKGRKGKASATTRGGFRAAGDSEEEEEEEDLHA